MNAPNLPRHDERNVRLLPRHWAWLEAQPRGVDASLRMLVQSASRDTDGRYRAARIKDECYWYMRDMAGDRPHFEDAVRALFADDAASLQRHTASWPLPIREHVNGLMDAMRTHSTSEGVA